MVALKIYRLSEPVSSVRLDRSMIKMGRSAECDVLLPDPTISRVHAILRQKDGRWLFEDCSRNGEPESGNRPIEFERIYELGVLYRFELVNLDKTTTEKTLILSRRPTQVIEWKESSHSLVISQARIIQKKTKSVRMIDQDHFTLGSHPSNDLVLDQEGVSQFHARIDRSLHGYQLNDLGSTNGCFVNGARVLKAFLAKSSEILIGPESLQFELAREEVEMNPHKGNEFFGMHSADARLRRAFTLAETVALTDAPVVIQGETGTGKELMARAVHRLSPRSENAFVSLNCAALPKELLESELFGHEKGAFTGAISLRKGAFELADGGSLFLDEVGEMDLSLQAKFLRALESGEFRRVGAEENLHASVRLISASHRDLNRLVREGRFREDLLYRLQVVPIFLPPLRERIDDIDLLVPHLAQQLKINVPVSPGVIESLKQHSFPGNIRELKNVLQRAWIEFQMERSNPHSKNSAELEVKHFRFLQLLQLKPGQSSAEIEERNRMIECLQRHSYNQSKAARELRLAISTFHDKMRRHGIEIPDRKSSKSVADSPS